MLLVLLHGYLIYCTLHLENMHDLISFVVYIGTCAVCAQYCTFYPLANNHQHYPVRVDHGVCGFEACVMEKKLKVCRRNNSHSLPEKNLVIINNRLLLYYYTSATYKLIQCII